METKVDGWFQRQKDIGWGYALAHWLPLVFLYYAISRRTITPLLYGLFGGFIVLILTSIVLIFAYPNMSEDEVTTLSTFAWIVANPILTKKGIDQARYYAKKRLDFGLNKKKVTFSE